MHIALRRSAPSATMDSSTLYPHFLRRNAYATCCDQNHRRPSQEQLQKAAEQIADIVNKTMGKPKKYISVSVEEYSFGEWEGVYNENVKDKDNVLVKPGYTNPKTFA